MFLPILTRTLLWSLVVATQALTTTSDITTTAITITTTATATTTTVAASTQVGLLRRLVKRQAPDPRIPPFIAPTQFCQGLPIGVFCNVANPREFISCPSSTSTLCPVSSVCLDGIQDGNYTATW